MRGRSPFGFTFALALAHALGGCESEEASPAVVRWDSAGVRIVESEAPRWGSGEGWTVDPEPFLDLAESGTEAPYMFFRVRDAVRLRDGSIAVADGGSNEVRYFSSGGRFLASVGGSGKGPGEFESLRGVERLGGDSLVAFDRAGGAAVVGDAAKVTRTFPLPAHTSELYRLDGSSFVALISYPSVLAYEGGSALIRHPVPVVRMSASGALLDTIATARGYEEFMWVTDDGPSGARPLMGRRSHLAVHGGRIYLGSADGLRFRVLSASGGLKEVVRVPSFDLSVSAHEIEAERQAYLGDDPPQFYRDLVAALPTPETRPAYSDMFVDSEGCVWLGAFEGRAALRHPRPRDWQVFGPTGEWLGAVRFPARFTVFEIGVDYVLGRWYDELDVEHVQMLRLERG